MSGNLNTHCRCNGPTAVVTAVSRSDSGFQQLFRKEGTIVYTEDITVTWCCWSSEEPPLDYVAANVITCSAICSAITACSTHMKANPANPLCLTYWGNVL